MNEHAPVAVAWGMLLRAACRLWAARLRLWLGSVREVDRPVVGPSAGGDRSQVESMVRAIQIAARWVPGGGNCLVQALAAQSWLAEAGVSSTLRIGVEGMGQGGPLAHAWLECDGEVVLGGPDVSRFRPLRSAAASHKST